MLLYSCHTWAGGTAAGTIISNTATVSYEISGVPQTAASSAPVTIKVDELIQPIVTWQDAAPVSVNSPGINDVMSFLLVNGGNGTEAFSLSRTNGPAPVLPGNYIPQNGTGGSIFIENGLQPGFQISGPNADTAYIAGTNDPSLATGGSKIIYVLSDTPSGIANNSQGQVLLAATSLTPGAAGSPLGTAFAGAGQGGGFAVVGTAGAQASAIGSYITSSISVVITKTVANITDPNGTAVAMPGAILTYQIAVAVSGTGSASNLVINDPLPVDTTYTPGSIIVDGVSQTDAVDADLAQFSANTISVSLGNVAAPANHVITFRATIN